MNIWDPAEAIVLITNAQKPSDVFGDDPRTPAGARSGRRLHRALAAAVHPDRAALMGVDRDTAAGATAELNRLYTAWKTVPAATAEAPHVVGAHGVYLLADRVWATDAVAAYATDDPGVRVEIVRRDGGVDIGVLDTVQRTLGAQGLGAFVPDVLDRAETAGRHWVAYRLPAGLVSLRQIRDVYPRGLDGRDWAWMARRILMTLDVADRPHGGLSIDTVLIHPEGHGVVLTGWQGTRTPDGDDLAELFATMLGDRSPRQVGFMNAAGAIDPTRRRREYDLVLRMLYGERRFRPFTLADQDHGCA